MQDIYVHLFHGRDTADEDVECGGYSGPVVGPFEGFQTTYQSNPRGIIGGDLAWRMAIPAGTDLVYFRGKFYGEYTVLGRENVEHLTRDGYAKLISPEDLSPAERGEACVSCGGSLVGRIVDDVLGLELCEKCAPAPELPEWAEDVARDAVRGLVELAVNGDENPHYSRDDVAGSLGWLARHILAGKPVPDPRIWI